MDQQSQPFGLEWDPNHVFISLRIQPQGTVVRCALESFGWVLEEEVDMVEDKNEATQSKEEEENVGKAKVYAISALNEPIHLN